MESDSDEAMERFWELGENVLRKIGLTSVPYLIQNIASDELEDTSMKLLKEFGDPVISELIRAIEHREVVEDTRMLWRVLEVLGSFGPRAAAALPALRRMPTELKDNQTLARETIAKIDKPHAS